MAPPSVAVARRPSTATPRSLRAWHDEVRRRQRDGDLGGAIALLRWLIEAAPDTVRLRHDLVTLLRQAGKPLAADLEAVRLDRGDAAAWSRLSRRARIVGDEQAFVAASRGWAAAAPSDPVAQHFAAIARSISEGAAHHRASDGYVRAVFDHYADSFDEHLGRLCYRGPEVVADLVHDLVDDGTLRSDASVADLGCGTGLVGHHLRAGGERAAPWDGSLVGDDLSPRMLELSADRRVDERPVYDQLVEADFVSFLAARPASFDAVVSADSLIYVGDLRPVFAATARALRPGGWLIATLEHAADGAAADRGYVPGMSGRYLHDAEWVEAELADTGFETIVVEELSVRTEAGRPVPGIVLVARLTR